jgi:hypothetical protein
MNWLMKSKGRFLIIFSVVTALIIQFLFSLYPKSDWLIAKWGAGDLLTYISTIVLGWLAIWQNDELQKTNNESQERLERISNRANEISVISKVVEYEMGKKSSIEDAFYQFKLICNSQKYLDVFITEDNGKPKTDLTMVLKDEMELDEAYMNLCGKLGVDFSGSDADDDITKSIRRLYGNVKSMVKHIKENQINQIDKDVRLIQDSRLKLNSVETVYWKNKEKKLNQLIKGNVELNNIESIF